MFPRFIATALAAAALLSAGTSEAEPPAAFELLERITKAYSELDSYSDLGEIERSATTAEEQPGLQFFETAASDDGQFLWRTHGETSDGFEERVVWTDGRKAHVYSSTYRQYKSIDSVIAELAHGFGRGSFEALVVPLLLTGSSDVFSELEGAAVDGPEACGSGSCWIVSTSRMAGTIETELWVDRETLLIREVIVSLTDATDLLDRTSPPGELTIRVRHHASESTPRTFEPPVDAQFVETWQQPPAAGPEPPDPWQDVSFQEEITVALFSVVARIVDKSGEPIRGLEPGDLRVEIGGDEIGVSSLDWSSSQDAVRLSANDLAEARALSASPESLPDSPEDLRGRMVVIFLQIDLQPTRIKGHLKILPEIESLLRSLHRDDRVAILSFDSHLKLWQDFSNDREATFASFRKAIGYGTPAPRRGLGVSLADHLDPRAARDAATPEKALQTTAEALIPLPGEKDLIYVGWGLGRYGAGGVRMTPDYEPAVRALDAAEATVFVLDVSQADNHSLEIGLQNVATHTGGTYQRTFHFASQAVQRLARTLGGHYVINIDRGALPEARGRLTIELKTGKGRVLFKPTILG
ncbi:MAG: hypothetical protein GY719_00350 [bacterium]|nr:hypothetical protein [bacterium]